MAASTARRWFDHVRRDLNTAWSAARGPRAERGNAAYFLHEAAEKLLKGLLVLREISVRAMRFALGRGWVQLVERVRDGHAGSGSSG